MLILSILTAVFDDLRQTQTYMRMYESGSAISSEFLKQLPKKTDQLPRILSDAQLHLKGMEVLWDEILRFKEKVAREVFRTKQLQKSSLLVNSMVI